MTDSDRKFFQDNHILSHGLYHKRWNAVNTRRQGRGREKARVMAGGEVLKWGNYKKKIGCKNARKKQKKRKERL